MQQKEYRLPSAGSRSRREIGTTPCRCMSLSATNPNSLLHEFWEARSLERFRAFLSPNSRGGGRNNFASGSAGGDSAVTFSGSLGGSSLSRSPGRFYDGSNGTAGPTKDEANARDKFGRTVLHLVASCKVEDKSAAADYLEALLQCQVVNVNLQDRENAWTALHR